METTMDDSHDVERLVHDLRNPLNSIAMTAELAKLQIEQAESTERVIENLETIVRICRDWGERLDGYAGGRGLDGQRSRAGRLDPNRF